MKKSSKNTSGSISARYAFPLFTLLMQLFHRRGANGQAAILVRRALRLADDTPLGLLKGTFRHSQAELFIREGRYTESIELCRAMLAEEGPVLLKASVRLALSGVYSRVGDLPQAIQEAERSMKAPP